MRKESMAALLIALAALWPSPIHGRTQVGLPETNAPSLGASLESGPGPNPEVPPDVELAGQSAPGGYDPSHREYAGLQRRPQTAAVQSRIRELEVLYPGLRELWAESERKTARILSWMDDSEIDDFDLRSTIRK